VLLILFATVLILIIAGVFLVRAYFLKEGEERLATAIAEADRLDPQWRWDDLLAQREAIPDEENSALRVLAVVKQLPGGGQWYPRRAVHPPDPDARPGAFPSPPEMPDTDAPPPGLPEEIQEIVPPERLTADLARDLRNELEKVKTALAEARRLADMPRGRYPIPYAPDSLSSRLDAPQQARKVVQLLALDAALAAEEGDLERALLDCRGAFNTARSVGAEPNIICFLIRVGCVHQAVQTLERILAQGQTSDQNLAAWQKLLEDEAKQPLFQFAVRGERAGNFNLMELMYTGQLNPESLANDGSAPSGKTNSVIQWGVLRPLIRFNQAAQLEMMTEAVEITKRNPAEQLEAWRQWEQNLRMARTSSPQLAIALLLAPAVQRVAEANFRMQALLQSARLALAAERYRLANGSWPEKPEQLVPRFIAAIPPDPFGQGRLQMKRRDGYLVFYSIGPNQIDDGGAIEQKDQQQKPLDIGFRLWDPDKRRQPPKPAQP
jgi:hypothetical protein